MHCLIHGVKHIIVNRNILPSAIKTSNIRLSTLASHPRATARTIRIDRVKGLTCFKKSFDTPPRPIVFMALRACLLCLRLFTLYNPIAVQCNVDKQYSYPPDNLTNNRDVFHHYNDDDDRIIMVSYVSIRLRGPPPPKKKKKNKNKKKNKYRYTFHHTSSHHTEMK